MWSTLRRSDSWSGGGGWGSAEVLIALGSAARALTLAARSTAEEPSHTNEGTLKQRSMGAAQSSLALGVFSFPPHLLTLRDHSF